MIIDIFIWRLNDETVLSSDTFLKIKVKLEVEKSRDGTRENCHSLKTAVRGQEYFEPL